jgi:hypothetical protein
LVFLLKRDRPKAEFFYFFAITRLTNTDYEDNCTGYMDGHVELKIATSTVSSKGGTANI